MTQKITEVIEFDTQEELDEYKKHLEQGGQPIRVAYNTLKDDLETSGSDSPIIPAIYPTGNATGKKRSLIKKAKTPTEKKPVQHNKIRQDELVKWTVFVQQETKTAVGLAVEKASITVTDWIDSRLREAATAELTKKVQPPIKTEDLVTDIVQQFADRMKADQAATAKAQNDLIERQGAQIEQLAAAVANRPATIKEMLFGKAKQG